MQILKMISLLLISILELILNLSLMSEELILLVIQKQMMKYIDVNLRQFESSIYAESKIDRSKIRLQRLKFVNNVEVKKTIVDESSGFN